MDGIVSKLDRIGDAVMFGRLAVLEDDRAAENFDELIKMGGNIQRWKAVLRKERKQKAAVRLQTLSKEKLSLTEVNAVVENKKMLDTFYTIARAARESKLRPVHVNLFVRIYVQKLGKTRSCHELHPRRS